MFMIEYTNRKQSTVSNIFFLHLCENMVICLYCLKQSCFSNLPTKVYIDAVLAFSSLLGFSYTALTDIIMHTLLTNFVIFCGQSRKRSVGG